MGVFNKLFSKKKKVDNTAQIAKQRLLSVCIAQTNTTGEERSELIQKIKAAVIQVVSDYYKTKIDADQIVFFRAQIGSGGQIVIGRLRLRFFNAT